MAYSLTTSFTQPATRSLASPKTHVPGSRLQERGHRFYSATLSRWINRDPIGERGGQNLYAFVLNSPGNLLDILGHGIVTYTYLYTPPPVGPNGGTVLGYTSGAILVTYIDSTCSAPLVGQRQVFDFNIAVTIWPLAGDIAVTFAHETIHVLNYIDMINSFNGAAMDGACVCPPCFSAQLVMLSLKMGYYDNVRKWNDASLDCAAYGGQACTDKMLYLQATWQFQSLIGAQAAVVAAECN